jgi:hypothetical protein
MKNYVQAACVFLITFTTIQAGITSAQEELFSSFNAYRLNASWIIPECMMLTSDEFDLVWEKIVTLLTQSEHRDFYFNGPPTWQECVRECKVLSDWLSALFIDMSTGDLIHRTKSISLPSSALSIFEYWKKKSKLNATAAARIAPLDEEHKTKQHQLLGFQFYAFYIDSLSHLYEEYSKYARDPYQEKVVSKAYMRLLTVCLRDLEKLLAKLKIFTTANHYTLAVKKLRDIKHLVDEQQL